MPSGADGRPPAPPCAELQRWCWWGVKLTDRRMNRQAPCTILMLADIRLIDAVHERRSLPYYLQNACAPAGLGSRRAA